MNSPSPNYRFDELPAATAPPARSVGPICRWSGRLFPLLLWLFGALYFGGDLGKWTDDYTTNARDPATGVSSLPLHWTYPRPLGNGLAYTKGTLLFEHDRLNHLIAAGAHALVVVLLWLLLRHLVQARTAAVGALLYLVCPMNHEVIFWPSATHAALSSATFLFLALAYLRFARGTWGWWSVPLMAALAYIIPCWWEQPASGIPALPLLYWAVRRPPQQRPRQILHALVPAIACVLVCYIYAHQVQAAVPPTDRGGRESIITAPELAPRLREIWSQVNYGLLGQGMTSFVKGAFRHALGILATWTTLFWGALLGIAAFSWVRTARFVPASTDPPANVTARHRLSALTFGLALFCLAWLPIMIIRGHGIAPRMFYFPLIGLVISATVLLDIAASMLTARGYKAPAAIFEALLAIAFIAGATCQVATQAALRQTYLTDQAEFARLKELIPQPCPDAVFTPVDIQYSPAATGQLHFDVFPAGAFGTAWSSVGLLQQGYRRVDVFGTWLLYGEPFPLSNFSTDGVRYIATLGSFKPYPAGGCVIPLSKLYPFDVDPAGQLRLVDELIVERIGDPPMHLTLPHVRAVTAAQGLPPRAAWLQEPTPAPDLVALTGWQRVGTNRPISFVAPPEWNVPNLATTLRAFSKETNKSTAMQTTLPANAATLDLLFRATLKEGDVRENIGGDAALLIYLAGRRQTPLARLELRRQKCHEEHRWFTVTVSIPPHAQPLDLFAEAELISEGTSTCGLRLTPGHFRLTSKS